VVGDNKGGKRDDKNGKEGRCDETSDSNISDGRYDSKDDSGKYNRG
jgi:hypothetical protein